MREGERELHPALRRWDFEDNDQGGNPILQKSGRSAAASVEGVHARACSVKLLTLRPIHRVYLYFK